MKWDSVEGNTVEEVAKGILARHPDVVANELCKLDQTAVTFSDGFRASHALWILHGYHDGLSVTLISIDANGGFIANTMREFESPRYIPPERFLAYDVAVKNIAWRKWVAGDANKFVR
jgi:hypothetical protein